MADEKEQEKQEEKLQEKEVEKHEEKFEEKWREEKFEEKWHRDPLSVVVGAAILIWAGVVLLAANLGLLDVAERVLNALPLPRYNLPWEIPFIGVSAWRLFFLGAGAIVLIEVVIRLLVPTYRKRVFGSIIGAIVLIALGLGAWEVIWPLVLIAIGASILLGGLLGKRRL